MTGPPRKERTNAPQKCRDGGLRARLTLVAATALASRVRAQSATPYLRRGPRQGGGERRQALPRVLDAIRRDLARTGEQAAPG
ncbi:hypothetical protein GCM10017559_43110 [Streptosporangium longisporum]|uniref:Uncharacterized protein n=1 Tax=Streptosporangium longisporum TaxID=46187 RepID=A0ABP6KP81_9ACTN